MSEGRIRNEWNHTAELLAWLGNLNRTSKTDPTFSPEDFHPLSKKNQRRRRGEADVEDTELAFRMMKKMFCGG